MAATRKEEISMQVQKQESESKRHQEFLESMKQQQQQQHQQMHSMQAMLLQQQQQQSVYHGPSFQVTGQMRSMQKSLVVL